MSNWNVLAELDPFWAILSNPAKKFGKWDPQQFFDTGDREAQRVLAMCTKNGIVPAYGKLLDFGCGVGRMTRAFSRFFSSCIGIDASDKMVELARKFNADRPDCEFFACSAPPLPFPDETFDFVFSLLVLQHLPRKNLILRYIAEFIRVAKDNGVVVFQLTNEFPWRQRLQGRRRLWSLFTALGAPQSWLFQKLRLSPIALNGISSQKVETLVESEGAEVKALELYLRKNGHDSYYYFVVKRPADSRVKYMNAV